MHHAGDLEVVLARAGWSRMAARVLAVLVLTNEPELSSAELGAILGVSAGAMSTATRELVGRGDVREVTVPGSRRRWFRAEDDLGDTAQVADPAQLPRLTAIVTGLLAGLALGDDGPRRRLVRLHERLVWLERFHRRMETEWAEHLRERKLP